MSMAKNTSAVEFAYVLMCFLVSISQDCKRVLRSVQLHKILDSTHIEKARNAAVYIVSSCLEASKGSRAVSTGYGVPVPSPRWVDLQAILAKFEEYALESRQYFLGC